MEALDCSICLEVVIENNTRSIAKLKCGHTFHLDCIGSEFNVRGLMLCPNCRDIENGNWLFLQYEEPYAQYEEEGETILLPESQAESYFGLPVEDAHIAETKSPMVSANGGPMQIFQQLRPIQNAANVNETVEHEPNIELSLALIRNGPAQQQNEQAIGIDLEIFVALRNGPVPRSNEQAVGINLELSLASRNGQVPQPNDQAAGTNLELSLAPNPVYVERYFSSQNMDVDDPMEETMMDSNEEEDDDEILHDSVAAGTTQDALSG